MSEYPYYYVFKKSNSIVSYLGLILTTLGLILFSYVFVFHDSSNMFIILNIVSISSINIGICIWEISFFQRARFFNIFYTPLVVLIVITSIPIWISILSPYGFILFDSVIFSNNFAFIGNQSFILVLKVLAIVGDILILGDIAILVFFIGRNLHTFYYSIPVLERFLQHYTENPSVSQLTINNLAYRVDFSARLTGTYVRELISYNPEIGEIDEINETFKNSAQTVPVLQEIIESLRKSPQQQFGNKYLREHSISHQINYSKDFANEVNKVPQIVDISQKEEMVQVDDRSQFYANLLDGSDPLALEPNKYITEVADQYINSKVDIKNGILFMIMLSMIIMIPMVLLGKKESIDDNIFLLGIIILIDIIMPIGVYGLESLMNKIFPGLNENPYRHLIKALETGNADIFVKEIKRIEDSGIKNHNNRKVAEPFFRFCKAYLMILTQNKDEAQKILESLKIPVRKRFALRGEIDLLLAGIYSSKNENTKSLKFLQEAKVIFEKNNIIEPIRLIQEKISSIENR